MLLPPSTSTRTDTRFPYATPCRGYGTKLCRAAARPGPFVGRSLTHVRELALPVIWPAAPDRRGDAVCWQSLGRAGWSARPARPAAARRKPSPASLHCAPAPTPPLARWDPGPGCSPPLPAGPFGPLCPPPPTPRGHPAADLSRD